MQQKHDFQIKPSDNEFLTFFTSYINTTHITQYTTRTARNIHFAHTVQHNLVQCMLEKSYKEEEKKKSKCSRKYRKKLTFEERVKTFCYHYP